MEQYAKQTMQVLLTAPSRVQTRYGEARVFSGVTETSVLFGIDASSIPDAIVSRNVALFLKSLYRAIWKSSRETLRYAYRILRIRLA